MVTQTENKIKRASSWFRPYVVNGKEVNKVCFYNNGQVLFESRRGWLEHDGRDVWEICGRHEVLNRNKLNLDGKDFIIKEGVNIIKKPEYTLYICANVEKQEESSAVVRGLDNWYTTKYKIFISAMVEKPYLYGDELKYRSEVIPFIMEEKTRIERNEKGKKALSLKEEFGKIGVDVSIYDIEKLIDNYEITKAV